MKNKDTQLLEEAYGKVSAEELKKAEARKAAAKKAAATRAADRKSLEAAKAMGRAARERGMGTRGMGEGLPLSQGYMPETLYDSKGTPNPKYYDFVTVEDDGYSLYKLKDEFIDVPVGKGKEVPDNVLWVKHVPHSQERLAAVAKEKDEKRKRAFLGLFDKVYGYPE